MLYAIEAAAGRHVAPRRLVLIDPAPITRRFAGRSRRILPRRQSAGNRAFARRVGAIRPSRSDPDAYRHRTFELSVAGYFADPRAAAISLRFASPDGFNVGMGEPRRLRPPAPGQLDSGVRADTNRARPTGSDSARLVRDSCQRPCTRSSSSSRIRVTCRMSNSRPHCSTPSARFSLAREAPRRPEAGSAG